MLEKIRNLTILIAIYLFFASWVYLHFYYHQFGLSASQLRIDYSDYLVYSYEVIKSIECIIAMICFGVVVLTWYFLSKKYLVLDHFKTVFLFAVMAVAFPVLFNIARDVAKDNYLTDRTHPETFKTVKFFFKDGKEVLSPSVPLDCVRVNKDEFADDILLIRADSLKPKPSTVLRLIGESENHYYVMSQYPAIKGSLPTGYVYFVNKEDVLFAKIYLITTKSAK